MGKKSGSGSGMNNQDHLRDFKNQCFGVKILKFFDEDPGWRQFGSGIRDRKKSDPGSGISIPDPPHC
jgi:hypothetical protein